MLPQSAEPKEWGKYLAVQPYMDQLEKLQYSMYLLVDAPDWQVLQQKPQRYQWWWDEVDKTYLGPKSERECSEYTLMTHVRTHPITE